VFERQKGHQKKKNHDGMFFRNYTASKERKEKKDGQGPQPHRLLGLKPAGKRPSQTDSSRRGGGKGENQRKKTGPIWNLGERVSLKNQKGKKRGQLRNVQTGRREKRKRAQKKECSEWVRGGEEKKKKGSPKIFPCNPRGGMAA